MIINVKYKINQLLNPIHLRFDINELAKVVDKDKYTVLYLNLYGEF